MDLDVRHAADARKVGELGFSSFRSPFILEVMKAADVRRAPKDAELVVACASDIELLREAAKNPYVDLLYSKQFDVDIGLIRDSAEKKKPFEIPVAPLLESEGVVRASLMGRMRYFIKQCVKLRAPLAIVSQARDEFGLKTPREMIAIGEALGLTHDQADWAISETPEMVLHARS